MPTIQKALARYRELLVAANPEAIAAQLAEGMKSGHMTYKTRGICQVLRPFFLSRFDYERLWIAHVTSFRRSRRSRSR